MVTQQPDSRPGFYYVSIVRDSRVGLLAGPFIDDHAAALAWVERARAEAERCDPFAVFDAFGTVRLTSSAKPGVLNSILGLPCLSSEQARGASC
ncbi:hypothetical protein [Azospirillum doebereinerae]|uniref:Uncharacterized protein n=1 Tax=Azospirillum doebereinerae TaxID=92933 RepID=A0A433IZK5_9PROT|nr:hypothetical protein [Azospirillum doebereinerae]RUQ61236.1 hypothetical protein EJ913_29985 [Azospirillum doebereinerae]